MMSVLPEDFDPHSVDFNALYQGGQLLEGVDLPGIPWDIGAAQPVVIEAERAGRFHGAVLDVGCGLGDNAIFLASQGHQVTGIDAALTAIEHAGQRARQRGVDVEFTVADATSLAGFDMLPSWMPRVRVPSPAPSSELARFPSSQDERSARDDPLLEAAFVAAEGVDVSCGVAVQAESGHLILNRRGSRPQDPHLGARRITGER